MKHQCTSATLQWLMLPRPFSTWWGNKTRSRCVREENDDKLLHSPTTSSLKPSRAVDSHRLLLCACYLKKLASSLADQMVFTFHFKLKSHEEPLCSRAEFGKFFGSISELIVSISLFIYLFFCRHTSLFPFHSNTSMEMGLPSSTALIPPSLSPLLSVLLHGGRLFRGRMHMYGRAGGS